MEQNGNKMYIDESQLQWKKSQQAQQPQRKAPKHRSVRALVAVFVVLMVALVGVGFAVYYSQIWGTLSADDTTPLEDEGADDVAGLPEVTFDEGDAANIVKSGGETDILLIGVDNRDSGKFSGRSDVMMYLRVNPDKGTIKLASFMRDTLVKIDGHDKNKLNTAYGFGSIELAKRTYYQSFGLTPDYYMVVNFFGMEDIINALGGVEVDVKSDELKSMNTSINEVNNIDSGGKVKDVKAGKQTLNGRQAVAYMRVRHPGGDSGRIQRQQNVLKALFKEMKNVSAGEIPGLLNAMVKYVRTDMPLGTMLDLANAVKGMEGSSDLDMFRYPQEYKDGNYKSMAVVQPTSVEKELEKLKDFLEN